MGPEELLTEEEVLKMLKINKAQLENYVREGRLSPLYQESVRKFKRSDLSEITKEPPIEPPVEIPLIGTPGYKGPERRKEEGSTRIIEPPKENREIRINKTGTKGIHKEETEKFSKPLERVIPTTQENWILISLSAAFVIAAFSIFMLTFNLKGKEIPPINKILGTLGSIPIIGTEESNAIKSQAESTIQSAQQTKKSAENLIKETEEFIKE